MAKIKITKICKLSGCGREFITTNPTESFCCSSHRDEFRIGGNSGRLMNTLLQIRYAEDYTRKIALREKSNTEVNEIIRIAIEKEREEKEKQHTEQWKYTGISWEDLQKTRLFNRPNYPSNSTLNPHLL